MLKLILLISSLLLVGCGNSWNGPAEITLINKSTLHCSNGLEFLSDGIRCYYGTHRHDKKLIPWSLVAGYRTL